MSTATDNARRLARMYADGDASVARTLVTALNRLHPRKMPQVLRDIPLLYRAVEYVADYTLRHRKTGCVHLAICARRHQWHNAPAVVCRGYPGSMDHLEPSRPLRVDLWPEEGPPPEICNKCLASALSRYKNRRSKSPWKR